MPWHAQLSIFMTFACFVHMHTARNGMTRKNLFLSTDTQTLYSASYIKLSQEGSCIYFIFSPTKLAAKSKPGWWQLQLLLEVLGHHDCNSAVDALLGDAFQELVVGIP